MYILFVYIIMADHILCCLRRRRRRWYGIVVVATDIFVSVFVRVKNIQGKRIQNTHTHTNDHEKKNPSSRP